MEKVCLICKILVIFWNNIFFISFPLSLCIANTAPPWPITWSMKAEATTAAVLPLIGMSNRNFENKSIAVRQYVSSLLPDGKGPKRSIQTTSPTNPLVLMNLFEGLAGLAGNLFCRHLWHEGT